MSVAAVEVCASKGEVAAEGSVEEREDLLADTTDRESNGQSSCKTFAECFQVLSNPRPSDVICQDRGRAIKVAGEHEYTPPSASP